MKEEAEAVIHTAKDVLQDLVVVVSLVRTLTDAFGSASDLYRKLKRKSHSRICSDDDDRDGRHHHPLERRRDSCNERGRERLAHIAYHSAPRREDWSSSEEELICTSSAQVRAEYDRGYRKLGEPFARGDLVTAQTQLQAQIIHLQQTLLTIHEDLLLSTYLTPSSSHSHLLRLIQTTRTARAASIQALHYQYLRLLPSLIPSKPDIPPLIPGAFPLPIRHHHSIRRHRSRPRRDSSSSSSDSSSDKDNWKPLPKPDPKPKPLPPSNRLFCVYARDLQRDPNLPLTDNYKAGGDNMCPFCRSHILVRPGKAWEIIADGDKQFDEHTKMLSRKFLVKNRFIVKSHRENGGFACVLCARFKQTDTVCRENKALMEHLWKEHTGAELEKDDDIVEC
ncbi:hypothetical protein IQ07DRAFT_13651 [Pyrenochaeta sp. DS3sAY3a]|nr:hypothetical protein IQ07DRAFT_13651 [Pyrenochaeta sp. DS3sAY3a]